MQMLINHRYRLQKFLGEGILGKVYLAQDLFRRRKPLAIKFIHPAAIQQEMIPFLKHEFRSLARLDHPNVVHVYDFQPVRGQTPPDLGASTHFFSSEYVAGRNFFEATRQIDLKDFLVLVVELCRALEYIHSRGIIHYDLKPPNVLVEENRKAGGAKRLKVLDFHLCGGVRKSSGGRIYGTIAYMAPEVIRGAPTDGRTDLYSLGVLLYEALAGSLPFAALDPNQVLAHHLYINPVALRMRNPAVPEYLELLVGQLLAKDPALRPPSANHVIRLINRDSGLRFPLETLETGRGYVGSPRMVGREKELEFLKELVKRRLALSKAEGLTDSRAAEARHTVLVVGPAGIGKSRLLRELRIFCQIEGIRCFQGSCYEAGSAAYQPFLDILSELAGPSSLAGGFKTEERRLFENGRRLLDELEGAAPGRSPEGPSWTEESLPLSESRPQSERAEGSPASRLREQLCRFLLDTSRRERSVFFLEDLHWADEGTLETLLQFTGLLDAEQPSALLCLSARQREGSPSWDAFVKQLHESSGAHVLGLGALGARETLEILQSMLGERERPVALAELVHQKMGGNPLFIQEWMRLLVDGKVMSRAEGGWSFEQKKIHALGMPGRVRDLIGKRLTALPRKSREIVQAAAVFGRPVTAYLIGQVLPVKEGAILRALKILEERGFLVREPQERPFSYYGFSHDVLRECAYQSVPPARQRALHRQAGRSLERLHRGRFEEKCEELAHHYRAAHENARAAHFSHLAAEKNRRLYAHQEALSFYRDTLAMLPARARRIRGRVWEAIGDICALTGEFRQTEKAFREARKLLSSLATPEDTIRLTAKWGQLEARKGRPEEALRYFQQALRLAKPTPARRARAARPAASELSAPLVSQIAQVHTLLGRHHEAIAMSQKALRDLGRRGPPHLRAALENGLARLLCYRGNFRDAVRRGQAAVRAARQAASDDLVAQTLNTLGMIYAARGSYPPSLRCYRESLDVATRMGDIRQIASRMNNLGYSELHLGQYSQAIGYFDKALEIERRVGDPRWIAMTLCNQAHAHLLVGLFPHAEQFLAEARALAEEKKLTSEIGYITRVTARLAWWEGNLARAKALYQAFLELYPEWPEAKELCTVHLELSELAAELGERDRAKHYLLQARQLLGEHPALDLELGLRVVAWKCRVTTGPEGAAEELPIELRPTSADLEKSIDNADRANLRPLQWELERVFAEFEIAEENLSSAHSHALKALGVVQKIYDSLSSEHRESFLALPRIRQVRELVDQLENADRAPA